MSTKYIVGENNLVFNIKHLNEKQWLIAIGQEFEKTYLACLNGQNETYRKGLVRISIISIAAIEAIDKTKEPFQT